MISADGEEIAGGGIEGDEIPFRPRHRAVEDQRLVVKEDRADCFDLMAGQPNNQEQRLVLDAGGVQK